MAIIIDDPTFGVRRFLINRPEKRNAINHEVRDALINAFEEARDDPECHAIVLGGVGKMFSAGGDIASMADLGEAGARERMQHIHTLCRAVAHFPKPVISAVEGVCAGAGVGLALLGDVVISDMKARFLFPFLTLGLAPDWGLLRTLPARVGKSQAMRILTLGQSVSADEAVAIGLADQCVGLSAMDCALRLAAKMGQLPQEAFARMKNRLDHPAASLDEEFKREEDDQAVLLQGADFREGFAAFGEKRQPNFGSNAGNRS